MFDKEEEEGQRKGKGHPRGKDNRGLEGRMNRGRQGGRGRNYNQWRGKNGKGRNNKIPRKKDYSDNFNRASIFNKNNDEYEEENEEFYGYKNNKNYYNNNNYSYRSYNYQSNKNKNFKKNYLKFKMIIELSNKEINDIIKFFDDDDKIYEKIKNTKFNNWEFCYLFMNIIWRISELNSNSAELIINNIIENTKFLETVDYYVEEKLFEEDKYLDFLYDVIKFLNKYLLLFSKVNIIKINSATYIKILEIKNENKDKKNEKIDLIINEIKSYKIKLNDQKEKIREEKTNINYKNIDVIIDTKDFTKEINNKIDENKIKGKYDLFEKYINTMFFLEFEDCYRNLRRAIFNLIKDGKCLNQIENKKEQLKFERKKHDIYCYMDGEIINVEMNHEGIFIIIEFTHLVGKEIKFTKRMINGSLVIIVDNEFEEFLLTTVSYNPYIESKLLENSQDKRRKERLDLFDIPKDSNRYKIKLELINIKKETFAFLIKKKSGLQLFESRAYFQSYIHVLNRIKQIQIKDLPFQNEIIGANFENLLIDNENEYKYKNEIIDLKNNKFPENLVNELDESQLHAIKHCLLNKIALIQGPPGTGKTHITSILTNIFRENLKNDSKILIVCFTNHALDQFLENIIKENETDVLRVGGRCKNEKNYYKS